MNWTKPILIAACLAVLAGCSHIKPILNQDGEEMIDIYRGAMADDEDVDARLNALEAQENEAENSKRNKKASKKQRRLKRRSRAMRRLDGEDAAKGQYVIGPNGIPLRFQCGVGGRIQDTPCGPSYGFPRIIERKATTKSKRGLKGAGILPPSADELAALHAEAERRARKAIPAKAAAPKTAEKPKKSKATLYEDFTISADNALKQLFPRLPNPDIVVYVTPHLATHNRVPVPGYTTAFPLYDEVHYAMPGEAVPHE